jgi:hypothetical protein
MKDAKVVKLQAAVAPHIATLLHHLSPDGRRRTVGEVLAEHAEAAAAAAAGAELAAEEALHVAGPPMGVPPDARPAPSAISVAGAGPAPPGSPDDAAAAAAAAEVSGRDPPDGVSVDMDISVSRGPAAAVDVGGEQEESEVDWAGEAASGGLMEVDGQAAAAGDGNQQGPAHAQRRDSGQEQAAGDGSGQDLAKGLESSLQQEQGQAQGAEAAVAYGGEEEEQLPAYSDVYPQDNSKQEEEEEVVGGQEEDQEGARQLQWDWADREWEVNAEEQEGGRDVDGMGSSSDDEEEEPPLGSGDTDSKAAGDGPEEAEGVEGPPSAASLLTALLEAPSSSTTALDMTGVFDGLATSVAGTLEALWELVALRAAALVRHAHGMCPVPGVTPPLEVVEYCQQYAELLLPPVRDARRLGCGGGLPRSLVLWRQPASPADIATSSSQTSSNLAPHCLAA